VQGFYIFWQTEACFEAAEKYKRPYFAKQKGFSFNRPPQSGS